LCEEYPHIKKMKQQSTGKKLHNEALYNLCLSDNITETESRIMRWAGHRTHRGIQEMGKKFCRKTLWVKTILIDLSTDRRKY